MNELKACLFAAVATVLVGCSSPTNTRPVPVAETSSAKEWSSASRLDSAWKHRQIADDLDGFITEVITIGEGPLSPSFLLVEERRGEISISVSADPELSRDIILADIIIDEERFDGVSLSRKGSWLVFKSAIDLWLQRLDEGRSLKIRFIDVSGRSSIYEFDISGSTNMR